MANLLKISDDYNSNSSIITASSKAVKSVYDIAQGSVKELSIATNATTGVTITFTKNNNNSDNIVIGTITTTTADTEKIHKTISAKVLIQR